jgi:hypothetical protein
MASGAGFLRGKGWARILSPFALGMLLYTIVVSPGYYAQLGNSPMVMFTSRVARKPMSLGMGGIAA